MSRPTSTALRRIPRRLRQAAIRRLYRDPDPSLDRALLIAGGARSGTTWLAELVASRLSGRLVFEPFQADLVPGFSGHEYLQYLRPDARDDALAAFAEEVLSGRVRNAWVDRYVEVLRPEVRVVKEIRANLFLRWLQLGFPRVPLVFIVRHPCAVVASRMALGWPWERDLDSMLGQPLLQADFLGRHAAAIEAARSPVEKHALIWCLTHLVPLSQFPTGELPVVFYEDLCASPERELSRALRLLGRPDAKGEAAPGRASMTDRVGAGARAIDGWRRELAPDAIAAVLELVRAFELDHLYGDDVRPTEHARRLLGVAE